MLVCVAAGCGAEPPRPGSYALAELEGKLVYDGDFLVVPNRAWRRDKEADLWFFGRSASLVCHVQRTPTEPIVFAFVPRRRGGALELVWNGEDVTGRARWRGAGELQIEIPPAWLAPGTHFLTLRRGADAPGSSGDEELFRFFRYIGYRVRGEPHVLEPRHFLTYRYLSHLLSFGLTGAFGLDMLGGFVFSGPRSIEIDLGSEKGGLWSARIQNSGAGRAFFRVRFKGGRHEALLTPHERRRLQLEIPRGARYLELEVEGDPNGLFLWGAPHFQGRGAEPLAPILLVTLDTTRRDALGAYGGAAAATPHLDALAARATVYDNAYTTAPWTLPAHASIFTGLYPSKHGAGVGSDNLDIAFDTLAERLRRRGYVTAGLAGGVLSSSHFGVGQGFATYRDVEGFETPADELTRRALDFVELRRQDAAPFFLFVNYFDPHFPYRAPRRFREAFDLPARRRALGRDGLWQETLDGSAKAFERAVEGEAPAGEEALAALAAAYRAEVAYVDEQLGKLLAQLEQLDLFERALIVVAADHGELLGEGGYFSHSARLDGPLVEIPLIVKWPGQRTPRRDGAPVSLVDLFPTILAAAGVPLDGIPRDGLTLRAEGGEPQLGQRAFVIAEEHDADFHPLPPRMRVAENLYAVLGREERLVGWSGGESCYRRGDDGWRLEICDGSRIARRGRELGRRLERAAFRPRVYRIGLSRWERERLRTLGYLR